MEAQSLQEVLAEPQTSGAITQAPRMIGNVGFGKSLQLVVKGTRG